MSVVYYADFVGKKLVKTVIIEDEAEKIPEMPDQVALDKLSYFAELVGNGVTTVKVNAQDDKVLVPEGFKAQDLTVSFSHTFTPDDLKYDELGISQTLSFKGQVFATKIPWEAVSYIAWAHGGSARVWPGGLPPQVLTFANKQGKSEDTEPDPPPLVA